jgi:hypothetical protein
LMAGVPIEVVAKAMGHSSTAAIRRYGRHDYQRLERRKMFGFSRPSRTRGPRTRRREQRRPSTPRKARRSARRGASGRARQGPRGEPSASSAGSPSAVGASYGSVDQSAAQDPGTLAGVNNYPTIPPLAYAGAFA